MDKTKIITVIGTTASGKSSLGITLAQKFNGEIISADSRQIFRGLDLGTGKVTKEEQSQAVHHLLDIRNVNESYSVFEFQRDCYKKIEEILSRGKNVFIVGGTGLYTRAVVEGFPLSDENNVNLKLRKNLEKKSLEELQKEISKLGLTFNESDIKNKRRLIRAIEKHSIKKRENSPQYEVLQIGIIFPRDELYRRIETRLQMRIDEGMIDEIKNLKKQGATNEFLENLGLEYRHTNRYLNGDYNYTEYFETLFKEIRHFAKRQTTWYKKEKNVHWLDISKDYEKQAYMLVEQFLKK